MRSFSQFLSILQCLAHIKGSVSVTKSCINRVNGHFRERLIVDVNKCLHSSYQVINLQYAQECQVHDFFHTFNIVYIICYVPQAELDLKECFTDRSSVY